MSNFQARSTLSFLDREFLENRVLPTARMWTMLFSPGSNMYEHGAKTLRHWDEPLDLTEAPTSENLRETVGESDFKD